MHKSVVLSYGYYHVTHWTSFNSLQKLQTNKFCFLNSSNIRIDLTWFYKNFTSSRLSGPNM